MNLWDNFKALLFFLWLVSIPLALVGMGGMLFGFFPQETTYDYEVKAQQVFDGDRVEDSDVTEFEDLSDDEQEILYEAFKKTDHFMGSAEAVTISKETRYETFTDWRTVESNGVLLLVAINEHTEERNDPDQYKWYHDLVMVGMLYFIAGLLFIMFLPPV